MKLSRKLKTLSAYNSPEPVIEEVDNYLAEEAESINEETEAYQKGQAYGKAFQAAIVLAIVVAIAVARARARMKIKMVWYSKNRPKRQKAEADIRLLDREYQHEREERIEEMIKKQADKIKKVFKKKRAEYAANLQKSQGELQGDSGLENIKKMEEEKLKKFKEAASEKLDREKQEKKLGFEREIEDHDRKWKKVQEKLDPRELFQKIAGQKGLGGVTQRFEDWKVKEDRKIADKIRKYEEKQIDNYIENDEDLKAIKQKNGDRFKKQELEWKKREEDIAAKIEKFDKETEDLEKEEKDLQEEYPDLEIAKNKKAEFDEAITNWQVELKAIIASKTASGEQAKALKELEKIAMEKEKSLGEKDLKALMGGKGDAKKVKDMQKAMVEELDQKMEQYLEKVRGDQERLAQEIEKLEDDVYSADSDVKKAEIRLEIAMKQKEIAQKDGDNDAQKEAEKEISIQKKNKKEAEQREKEDNNSLRPMRLTKKLISLNEWLHEAGNPEPKEAPESSSSVHSDVADGEGLSQEIDTILDKLKDLENSIDESVITSINEMNPIAFIKDWMKSGKVKSMQMQANKLKIAQVDMELASKQEGLDDKKKEMLKQKLDGMDDQIDQVEDAVDQMAEGPISSKAASITRAQGNLKVTKMKLKGADGKGKASLKARMQKINQDLNDEIAAMKELADKNKDNIADAKKKKKEGTLPGPDDGQKKKNADKKKELKADRKEKEKKKKEDAGKSDDEKKNDAKKKQIDDQVARLEKKIKGAKKALSNPNVPDAKKGEIQKNIDKLEKQIADQKAKLGGKKPAAKKPAAPPPPPGAKKKVKPNKKDGPKTPPPIPGKENKKDNKKDNKKVPDLPPIPGKKKKKKDEETNDSYNYSSENSILLEGALLETVSANLFLIEQELDEVIENINSNIERV